MSDAVFYCCVLVVFILFAGDPDIHDAIMEKLTHQDSCTSLITEKGHSDE